MSQERTIPLDLTESELRKMLMVCAKELIPMLAHNGVDPLILGLLQKGTAALAPQGETDYKHEQP